MKIRSVGPVLLACLFACVLVGLSQVAGAQDDVSHIVTGVVKHIDRDAKTMVVKAEDGTEHTIKYTDKTTWKGTKDAGKGLKEGSKVTVKYSEKGGEKTADAVKATGKDVGKAME